MNRVKNFIKSREFTGLLFLVLLYLGVGLVNPSFLSSANIVSSINSSVVFTLVSIAIAFVLFTGEIDVSIGANLGLVATIVGSMLRDGHNWALAFAVGISIGILIGAVNGLGVAVFNAPSLIFTLGTNGILRGIMFIYTNGAWVEQIPREFKNLSTVRLVGGISAFYFAVLIIVILAQIYISKTKHGRRYKAVGDNPMAANLVGIPVIKTKFLAYLACGIFAAIAGILFTSRIGFVTTTSGLGYEMKAVAACVLGGISLAGGTGSLFGATIGSIIMGSISYLLVFLGFSSNYDNTITGLILIAIVVIDAILQNKMIVDNRHKRLLAKTQGTNEHLSGGEK